MEGSISRGSMPSSDGEDDEGRWEGGWGREEEEIVAAQGREALATGPHH